MDARVKPGHDNLGKSSREHQGTGRLAASAYSMQWQFWIIQTLNSVAFGGLLFLLSSGFSLIFGLMRIPNLAHGAFFMLGAYFGYTLLQMQLHFWLAAIVGGLAVGLIGIVLERFILRRLAGNEQGQVLVTLGVAFIIADICLLV